LQELLMTVLTTAHTVINITAQSSSDNVIITDTIDVIEQGCGLGLDVSVSRCTNVCLCLISRKIVNVSVSSWSRDADVSVSSRDADVSVSSRPRPFTSRAQDQFSTKLCRPQYAVWTGYSRCKPML